MVNGYTWELYNLADDYSENNDLAAKMPRPGGFRHGDTVAVVGIGPVGVVHVAKASLMGASRVIAMG